VPARHGDRSGASDDRKFAFKLVADIGGAVSTNVSDSMSFRWTANDER
jgi:hypothetical protein